MGVAIVLVLCLLSPTAHAAGIGVAPSTMELNDAIRGAELQRMVTVFNPDDEVEGYTLNVKGEAGSWISFYVENDPLTPIEKVIVPGSGKTKVLVKFNIPDDAPNRKHEATIFVATAAASLEKNTSGQTIKLGAPVDVIITVTGTQILNGIVKGITTSDTEVNYPLRIKVEFQSTGNVIARPEIKVEIIKDGTMVGRYTHSGTKVKAGSSELIPVEWDTTGKETGDYKANVAVSLGGKVLSTKELPFKLMPIGTLSRQGSLTDLIYDGEPSVGKLIKVLGTFRNTGEIDTKANLIGEVYVDGDLVDTIESKELLVPVRETGTLTAYQKLEKDGSYAIKGHALYEGKMTETKELSFDVRAESELTELGKPTSKPTEPEKQTKKPLVPGFEAFGVIIAIASVMVCLKYRRRKSL